MLTSLSDIHDSSISIEQSDHHPTIRLEENSKQSSQKTQVQLNRGHHFIGTLNNPNGEPKAVLQHIYETVRADYCVGQLQIGKEKGTLHLQFYCYFKANTRFSTVRNRFSGPHYEVAREWRAVLRYVQKSQTRIQGPWQFGQKPNFNISEGKLRRKNGEPSQKKEKRIRQWAIMDTKGASGFVDPSLDLMCSVYTYSNLKKCEQYRKLDLLKPYCHNSLRGVWVYGPAGSGKDYFIRRIIEKQGHSVYEKDRTRWFTDYSGEQVIYQPNVEKEDVKSLGNCWKRLAQENPVKLQYKAVRISVQSQHRVFIISSIYPLKWETFEGMIPRQEFDELERRFQVLTVQELAAKHSDIPHWSTLPLLKKCNF